MTKKQKPGETPFPKKEAVRGEVLAGTGAQRLVDSRLLTLVFDGDTLRIEANSIAAKSVLIALPFAGAVGADINDIASFEKGEYPLPVGSIGRELEGARIRVDSELLVIEEHRLLEESIDPRGKVRRELVDGMAQVTHLVPRMLRDVLFLNLPVGGHVGTPVVTLTWLCKPAQDRPVEPRDAPRKRPSDELADAALPRLESVAGPLAELRAKVKAELEAAIQAVPDRPLAAGEARSLAHTFMDMADALNMSFACPGPGGSACGHPARISAVLDREHVVFRFTHAPSAHGDRYHAQTRSLAGLRLVPAPRDRRRKS